MQTNAFLDHKKLEAEKLGKITKWLFIKKESKTFIKNFAKNKVNERDMVISQLSENIMKLQYEIAQNPTQDQIRLLTDSQSEIEELLQEKTKGAMFQSKCTWAELGQKNSKYFFNMEKRRCTARTCAKLIKDDGSETTDKAEIIKMQKDFYKQLYKLDPAVNFDIVNNTNIRVPEHVMPQQDKPFSKEEIAIAVKQLANQKTPGYDGISIDFIKFFWTKLGDIIYDMICEIWEQKELPNEFAMAVINLIPKLNKDTRLLANLRPISLLNSDCKIIEKALANRLLPTLEEIIDLDQKGFMKQRRISINIRRILDLIDYSSEEQLELMVLSLDFAKCFDKIKRTAIAGAFDFFGFGEYIKQWTNIIYRKTTAIVQNSGFFSEEFQVEKGVCQGGPASSLYFLICAEILAILLRTNPSIDSI